MDTRGILGALGHRVRKLRQQRGWSQEELAHRCGRHFSYLGRIERGDQNVTVEVLYEIAAALEVGLPILFEPPASCKLLDRWGVTASDVVEAISHGFRAQVDVKGKLAELMLARQLGELSKAGLLTEVEWLDKDGRPDFVVRRGGRELLIECKNVRSPDGKRKSPEPIRVEIQKTRNAMNGTPTRAYGRTHFHVLSACLFNRTGRWSFLHVAARNLATRKSDPSLLKVMQVVPPKPTGPWKATVMEAIEEVGKT